MIFLISTILLGSANVINIFKPGTIPEAYPSANGWMGDPSILDNIGAWIIFLAALYGCINAKHWYEEEKGYRHVNKHKRFHF